MVDEVRVLRLLRAVTDDLAVLARERATDRRRRADPIWLRGIKYTFVTAIEACVDVAQHICAAERWGPPRDNGDAFRVLAAHDVIEPELGRALRAAVGFRNILVHQYVGVDDSVVLARLEDHAHLEDFVAAVAGWLGR